MLKSVVDQADTRIFSYLFKTSLQIALQSLIISSSKGHNESQKKWNTANVFSRIKKSTWAFASQMLFHTTNTCLFFKDEVLKGP